MIELTDSYGSYPKIYNLGHRALATLLDGDVVVQEKVDGSQISFGKFDGTLKIRSRNRSINIDAPDKMFNTAVEQITKRYDLLTDGYTYRGEYLKTPSHNTLSYERTPKDNIILFDCNTGDEAYMYPYEAKQEADKLQFEYAPVLFFGQVSCFEALEIWLDKHSILGGPKVEGVVIKNYTQFGTDKKALMGKLVSQAFKEKHQGVWKAKNPSQKDIIYNLAQVYKHENRWIKAVQRLRDEGTLSGSVKDIGKLCKEVPHDVKMECEDEIKAALFKWAWPTISKTSVAGLAEWYKEKLNNDARDEELTKSCSVVPEHETNDERKIREAYKNFKEGGSDVETVNS